MRYMKTVGESLPNFSTVFAWCLMVTKDISKSLSVPLLWRLIQWYMAAFRTRAYKQKQYRKGCAQAEYASSDTIWCRSWQQWFYTGLFCEGEGNHRETNWTIEERRTIRWRYNRSSVLNSAFASEYGDLIADSRIDAVDLRAFAHQHWHWDWRYPYNQQSNGICFWGWIPDERIWFGQVYWNLMGI